MVEDVLESSFKNIVKEETSGMLEYIWSLTQLNVSETNLLITTKRFLNSIIVGIDAVMCLFTKAYLTKMNVKASTKNSQKS